MSDAADPEGDLIEEPVEIEVPIDPLAGHPASAYFWGHVAGGGRVSEGQLEIVTGDERAVRVLAAIAGGGDLERETTRREYAHDASITRTETEYTLSLSVSTPSPTSTSTSTSTPTPAPTDPDGDGDDTGTLLGRQSTLGFPVDGRGNYRFGAFADHRRTLLRGLLESCGTVCFKSSSGTVGVSFVHEDPALLERIRDLIADCPVDVPVEELSETSSGGYWFGVADQAAPAFGTWVYEGCAETGLYARSRRRKLERSLEQVGLTDGDETGNRDEPTGRGEQP
ncbi:hypothetical protein [Halobiforma nitratireducens]|uniref:Cobalamin biosynthesis protein n=1 Tax=Halobiforma nitratireducens JCM 10879 TaxID=1227454 RepID=M0MD67_9EURY|nr:hypothetical protein [Halobiforma nitratireducens]EMA42589.1 hypothetical protein C446_03978 [Halobiforma nitratireducens JCM 10879]